MLKCRILWLAKYSPHPLRQISCRASLIPCGEHDHFGAIMPNINQPRLNVHCLCSRPCFGRQMQSLPKTKKKGRKTAFEHTPCASGRRLWMPLCRWERSGIAEKVEHGFTNRCVRLFASDGAKLCLNQTKVPRYWQLFVSAHINRRKAPHAKGTTKS